MKKVGLASHQIPKKILHGSSVFAMIVIESIKQQQRREVLISQRNPSRHQKSRRS